MMGNSARKEHLYAGNWQRQGDVEVTQPQLTPNAFAESLLQSISNALDGPNGVDPTSLIAAIGALSGYCARWIVMRDIRAGHTTDDFHVPKGTNRPYVSVSNQVNAKVSDMTGASFASCFVSAMMAANANWLPNVRETVMHNFMAINSPNYPDYTVDEKYWPKTPPQALLLMLWESQAQIMAATKGAPEIAMQAYAIAATKVAQSNRHKIPMDQSGQLALETAIAMSKINYGF